MDFLAVSRCVRAGPRRFLSWFNHLQLPAPLVEAPRSYPEFSRQLTNIFASLHPCDSHSLKFPGVSLSLHLWFLSRKLFPILCATSRVHSIESIGPWCLQKDGQVGRTYNPDWPVFRAFVSAPVHKKGVLSLGGPSFSISFLKTNQLEKYLVVARCTEMWLRMPRVPEFSP